MSFVFYDTETTGTNTAFDQILQFGAIRTDHDLNELDRFEIRSRLLPYVVPSPGAVRVTGIGIGRLTDPALPSHYRMVRAIRAKMAEWSPAIFIGHNSLGFDEHLLRQALYKTLHAPYLTNTNGNCRTDSLRMIQAVARFAPNTLSIPLDDRGRPVFKLDRLAPANGFDHSAAHDAMGDVEATIHMCRLIAERVPEHWSNFVRFAQKAAVADFALDEDVFVLTDFFYGKGYSWFVTGIGMNPDNGSEMLVFDLSQDPDDFAALSDDNLAARLIAAFGRTREEKEPSPHVEEQIYDGFTGNDDQALLDRFHDLEWHHRPPLIGRLGDGRLRALGQRLVFVEAAYVMPHAARRDYEIAIARRLMVGDGTVPWLTLPKAIEEADDLLAGVSPTERALLAELRHYLTEQAEAAASLIA